MQWLADETWIEIDSQTAILQSTIIPGYLVRTGWAHCHYKWISDGHLLKLTSTCWWALHTEKKGKELNVDRKCKVTVYGDLYKVPTNKVTRKVGWVAQKKERERERERERDEYNTKSWRSTKYVRLLSKYMITFLAIESVESKIYKKCYLKLLVQNIRVPT